MGAAAAIALAAAIIGTGVSVYGSVKAGEAAKKAETAKANLARVKAKREQTQQIREARIRSAQILQQGANQGAGESSSVDTGSQGVFGQAFGNIGYINQQASSGEAIHVANQEQINAQGTAVLGQGIAAIGSTVFNNRQEFEDIFGSTKKKAPTPTDDFGNPVE